MAETTITAATLEAVLLLGSIEKTFITFANSNADGRSAGLALKPRFMVCSTLGGIYSLNGVSIALGISLLITSDSSLSDKKSTS